MAAYEIEIKVQRGNGNLNFTYRPSALHVHDGDQVRWMSKDGPFAVEFEEDTPAERMGTHGEQRETEWISDAVTIRDNARGRYHYGAAVSLQNERFGRLVGRVALDAGCPEIIVD